jgi:glycosyltransferase involved in cell wall biosynthesis
MKVLHVIARMNVGGTATYLFNLLEGLENSKVETKLIIGSVPRNETEDSRVEQLDYQRIPGLSRAIAPVRDLLARRKLWEIVKDYQPDLIHCHTFKAGLLVRSKKTSIPIIHTFHGHHLYDPDYGKFARLVLNGIERKLARRSKKILTIGSRVGEELLGVGIGKKSQYQSIVPGVRVPKISDRSKIVERFSLNPDCLNVLWMGRLTRVKRPDRVIEIAKHYPEVNFIMAGDGELRQELEAMSPDNVYFLGVQSSDEMFSLADIVLLTSDSEGMPLTLIEGQVAGVPAIATDVGSVSEIVEHEATGLVTSTQIEQMISSLGRLMDDSMLRSTMSENARKRALSRFSIETMVDSHIQVYKQALK